RREALKRGEGYGTHTLNEPDKIQADALPNPWLAILPLVLVAVSNKLYTMWIPSVYGKSYTVDLPGLKHPLTGEVSSVVAIWAVEAALLTGIAVVVLFAYRTMASRFAEGSKAAVAGSLL